MLVLFGLKGLNFISLFQKPPSKMNTLEAFVEECRNDPFLAVESEKLLNEYAKLEDLKPFYFAIEELDTNDCTYMWFEECAGQTLEIRVQKDATYVRDFDDGYFDNRCYINAFCQNALEVIRFINSSNEKLHEFCFYAALRCGSVEAAKYVHEKHKFDLSKLGYGRLGRPFYAYPESIRYLEELYGKEEKGHCGAIHGFTDAFMNSCLRNMTLSARKIAKEHSYCRVLRTEGNRILSWSIQFPQEHPHAPSGTYDKKGDMVYCDNVPVFCHRTPEEVAKDNEFISLELIEMTHPREEEDSRYWSPIPKAQRANFEKRECGV